MKSRHEVAKRLDEVMAEWRLVNAKFRKTPLDRDILNTLNELEIEIRTLRWVLERS